MRIYRGIITCTPFLVLISNPSFLCVSTGYHFNSYRMISILMLLILTSQFLDNICIIISEHAVNTLSAYYIFNFQAFDLQQNRIYYVVTWDLAHLSIDKSGAGVHEYLRPGNLVLAWPKPGKISCVIIIPDVLIIDNLFDYHLNSVHTLMKISSCCFKYSFISDFYTNQSLGRHWMNCYVIQSLLRDWRPRR